MKNLKNYLVVSIFIITTSMSAQVITNGLVGYWPLDGNANDTSGNGIHGTVYGAIPTSDQAGNFDSAYSFDGANDYIQIPANALLNMTNNFTISAWIKLSSNATTTGMGIVKWGENIPGGRRCIMIWGGSTATNKVYWSGAYAAANVAGPDIVDDTWYHVTVTVNQSNLASVYVNGTLQNSGTVTLNSYNFTGVKIGATLSNNIDEHFDGTIDEVGIYNRVLTAQEISTIYNTPPSGNQICTSIFCDGDKVGIGVTNPEARLNVSAPYPESSIGWTDMTKAGILVGSSTVGIGIDANEIVSKGGSLYFGTMTSGSDVIFRAGSTATRMFIDGTTGYVGIGTDDPKKKMHIEGSLLLDAYSDGDEAGIFFREGFQTNNKYNLSIMTYDHSSQGISSDGLSINAHDGVSFSTGSNSRSEKMRLTSAGNLGIGVLNPTEILELNDGSTTTLKLGTSDTAGNYELKITAKHDYGNKFSFIYGPNVIMQEKAITDVGGATHSKLYFSNYYGIGFGTHTTNVNSKDDIDLYISGSGDTNGSGNVGIGTTIIPVNYKLAVAGKIITEEVKVKLQSSWPDYVFKKEYKLLSVEEVEEYIKKNGHLPKMPSAKEVAKGGFLLGEMNKKLLEKIEELTLYTIDQEKKLGNQNQQISKQEKLIEELLKRVEKLENK